jgi:uncharacterized protein (TIGR02246 family)
MADTNEPTSVLIPVLDRWADAVTHNEPERVASYFTEDAIFQGFDKTQTVGRPGVAAYYDKQPLGLTPTCTVLETRALSSEALLGYVDVDFALPTGVVIPVHLTVVLVRRTGDWLIQHYHVSKIEA